MPMDILNSVAAATVVMGFVGGMFSFFILRPLNNAIVELRLTMKEIRTEIRVSEERRQNLEIKLTEVDQRSRSAHHRIDELVGAKTRRE